MGLPINPKIHYRGAIAAKAAKALALSRFWDQLTLSEPGGQIMPTTVLWALSGSNSPWRPCTNMYVFSFSGPRLVSFNFTFLYNPLTKVYVKV